MPEPEIKLDFCKRDKQLVGYDVITKLPNDTVWTRFYRVKYRKEDLSVLLEKLIYIRIAHPNRQYSIGQIYRTRTSCYTDYSIPISDEEAKQLISPL